MILLFTVHDTHCFTHWVSRVHRFGKQSSIPKSWGQPPKTTPSATQKCYFRRSLCIKSWFIPAYFFLKKKHFVSWNIKISYGPLFWTWEPLRPTGVFSLVVIGGAWVHCCGIRGCFSHEAHLSYCVRFGGNDGRELFVCLFDCLRIRLFTTQLRLPAKVSCFLYFWSNVRSCENGRE